MKYKVGDKVRIVSNKIGSGGWNGEGLMDKWLGKTMTISRCWENNLYYSMLEDDGSWVWGDSHIKGLAEKETKPKEPEMKYKPNDKVVFFNVDTIKLESGKIYSVNANYRINNDKEESYLDVNYEIQTDNFFYIGIEEKLIFSNKKEFYDVVD